MYNIFNKFILWIRRVFHLRPTPIDDNQEENKQKVANPTPTTVGTLEDKQIEKTISLTQRGDELDNTVKDGELSNEPQKGISTPFEGNIDVIKPPKDPAPLVEPESIKQPVDEIHYVEKTPEVLQQVENTASHTKEPSNVLYGKIPTPTQDGKIPEPILKVDLPIQSSDEQKPNNVENNVENSSPKAPKEKNQSVESEEQNNKETQKPYIKTTPTIAGNNKIIEKPKGVKKNIAEITIGKEKYLGKIKTVQTKRQPQKAIESTNKTDKTLDRKDLIIVAPYLEFDFNKAKVFFVIPEQFFKTNAENNAPQNLFYKLYLNEKEQYISVKLRDKEQEIATTEEKRIELDHPLKSFKIFYPDELKGGTYSYQHSNESLYSFIATGKSSGKMLYLFDNSGNFIPLPKRDVWILLDENFDLLTEANNIGERWLWEKYRPININLKETNEVIIKDKRNNKEFKIPCKPTFYIEGDELIDDDFKEQSPLFVGKTIKIKTPEIMKNHPSVLRVWIQNKKAGFKIISNNRVENNPLDLKLPDDLPCECGEFQVDICDKDDRIPIETLFFRYVPSLKLAFPKDLIIPDITVGHKNEIIKIFFGKDDRKWKLKTNDNVKISHINNAYQIELPPQQDVLHFSLNEENKSETEVNFKITVPRLKWRTFKPRLKQTFTKDANWYDNPIHINRKELISGIDFYLEVRTNDLNSKYDLSAILEANGQRLQEAKFIQKYFVYDILVNQFYDTIKKNRDSIRFVLEIRKAKTDETLCQIPVIDITSMTKEKPPDIYTLKNVRPIVKSGRKKRKGKGFSRQELIKANIKKGVIHNLSVRLDKRRKTAYPENIETLISFVERK